MWALSSVRGLGFRWKLRKYLLEAAQEDEEQRQAMAELRRKCVYKMWVSQGKIT